MNEAIILTLRSGYGEFGMWNMLYVRGTTSLYLWSYG